MSGRWDRHSFAGVALQCAHTHTHYIAYLSPQMFELAVATDDTEEVRVEGMPPETYLERFAWDEAKYPPRRPLAETVSAITDIVQQLEDGLKVGTPALEG
jgi:V-ATPase subunit C